MQIVISKTDLASVVGSLLVNLVVLCRIHAHMFASSFESSVQVAFRFRFCFCSLGIIEWMDNTAPLLEKIEKAKTEAENDKLK